MKKIISFIRKIFWNNDHNEIINFISNNKFKILTLLGNTNAGKTTLGRWIYLNLAAHTIYLNSNIHEYKIEILEKLLNSYKEFDYIIIDDIDRTIADWLSNKSNIFNNKLIIVSPFIYNHVNQLWYKSDIILSIINKNKYFLITCAKNIFANKEYRWKVNKLKIY